MSDSHGGRQTAEGEVLIWDLRTSLSGMTHDSRRDQADDPFGPMPAAGDEWLKTIGNPKMREQAREGWAGIALVQDRGSPHSHTIPSLSPSR